MNHYWMLFPISVLTILCVAFLTEVSCDILNQIPSNSDFVIY